MCDFIFVGLPAELDEAAIDALAKSKSCRLRPGWMTISGHGLAGEVFYSTAKHCNCGTAIGSSNRHRETGIDRIERRRKVWRRKKWSEAKIARAIAAMTDEHLHAEPEVTDTDKWVDFLNALLRVSGMSHVSLVLHRAGSEQEFEVADTRTIRLSHISHEELLDWQEDVLYVCTA